MINSSFVLKCDFNEKQRLTLEPPWSLWSVLGAELGKSQRWTEPPISKSLQVVTDRSQLWLRICVCFSWLLLPNQATPHCSTIYNRQDMEVTSMSINRGMDKEDIWWKYCSVIKRNGTGSFVGKRMGIETVIQEEGSQKEKNKYHILRHICEIWSSLMAQMVKNPPIMQKPRFDPWVKEIPYRREWQPTPVFLPGEFHGQRRLVGCSPPDHKELDMTEWHMHKHTHESRKMA